MQLASFIFVGLGGAVGAMLRYAVSLLPYKGTFPVLTLVTNLGPGHRRDRRDGGQEAGP